MSKEGRWLMGRGIVSIHVHRIRYSECSFGFGGCFFLSYANFKAKLFVNSIFNNNF